MGTKYIQIIDGADNCTFSIFACDSEGFAHLFPAPGQDIEFAEDLALRWNAALDDACKNLWTRPVRKQEAMGIHGTIFYGFSRKRKYFPATKCSCDMDDSYVNAHERALNAASRAERAVRLAPAVATNRTVFMVQPGVSGQPYRDLLSFLGTYCTYGAMPIWPKQAWADAVETALGTGLVGHRKCGRWPLMDGTVPHLDLFVCHWRAALPLLYKRRRPISRLDDDPVFEVFGFDSAQTLVYGTFSEYRWAWLSLTAAQAAAMPESLRAIVRPPRRHERSIESEIASPEVNEILAMSRTFSVPV